MEKTLEPTPFLRKIRFTFELIKFSHSVFALPFALVAYFVATRGELRLRIFLWVILCVVLARTAAMAFNRLVDAKLDALNPRTQNRHLPTGQLGRGFVLGLTILASIGFILSASQLNTLSFFLSPACLLLLFFYSFTKRFTHFTQFFLGMALGMAPIGATIAVAGNATLSSFILGFAVMFWVAGFDILYSLQDLDFDRSSGLHSLPVKLGVKNSLRLSTVLHLFFLIFLFGYGVLENLGLIYWVGVSLTSLFLIWEHWLVHDDLTKIEAAFFTANGLLSLFFLVFTLSDLVFLN